MFEILSFEGKIKFESSSNKGADKGIFLDFIYHLLRISTLDIRYSTNIIDDVAPSFLLQDLEFVRETAMHVSIARPSPKKSAREIRAALLILRVHVRNFKLGFARQTVWPSVLPTRVMQIRRLYEITWNTPPPTRSRQPRDTLFHTLVSDILLTGEDRGVERVEREREKR